MNVSAVLAADKTIAYVDPACANHGDGDVIESKKFVGRLNMFVWGDYLHGEFIDNTGKSMSLFIDTSDESCFLALHKGEDIVVTYNTVCRYIEEGAGIYPAKDILQIRTKKADFLSWRKEFNLGANYDFCNKLVDKYTREP
jgi:hypothetical protein